MHDVQSPSHAADLKIIAFTAPLFFLESLFYIVPVMRANFISKTPPFQDTSLMENNVKKITHK